MCIEFAPFSKTPASRAPLRAHGGATGLMGVGADGQEVEMWSLGTAQAQVQWGLIRCRGALSGVSLRARPG